MPSQITAKASKENKKSVTAGLIIMERGWYDISAPDKKIKYIFYPGANINKDPFYKENESSAIKNLSFISSLIKEKLFNIPEDQPGNMITVKPKTYTIKDLNIGILKKYDIDTIYIGEEFSEGSTSYRKDGSIIYGVESDAYQRIWDMTSLTDNEEMAIIGTKKVLVLPSYFNNSSTGCTKDYGYTFTNGNIICPLSNTFETIATIHTHPSGSSPSTYTGTSYGDLGISSLSVPFKPNYVLRMNNVNKIAFIYAAENVTRKVSDFQYYVVDDIQKSNNKATITNLFSGSFSIIKYTTQYRTYFKTHLNELYKK